MTEMRDPIEQAALTWLLRINDPEFVDWDVWEAWLAEDDRHGEVYWRMAENEADIVGTLARTETPMSEGVRATVHPVRPGERRARPGGGARKAPLTRTRRSWVAVGAATAAAVVGAVWIGWTVIPQTRLVETGQGEQRTVTLADGSQVYLAGATRLAVDRRAPRAVTLEAGRAVFEVAHDARHPFTVDVGSATVTQIGTVFDVTRLENGARVAVSEGVVRFGEAGRYETLRVGESLTSVEGRLTRRTVDVEAVAGWRSGRLAYEQEDLSVVAQDLARETGRTITVDPALADRTFSGGLSTGGSAEALRKRLELLMDVTVEQDRDSWHLRPPAQ